MLLENCCDHSKASEVKLTSVTTRENVIKNASNN